MELKFTGRDQSEGSQSHQTIDKVTANVRRPVIFLLSATKRQQHSNNFRS